MQITSKVDTPRQAYQIGHFQAELQQLGRDGGLSLDEQQCQAVDKQRNV